ncbi:MAG TPA: transporter substrate-binding domain-containing protein [Verrucomicrobiae bacterium]|jgi:ABC-type amino acid transport substrate-binding protein|nr:transporter substrate-binding domain-containing protein [Verrucomicrobiae bacterium]
MKLTSPTLSRRMFLATTAVAATGLIVRPARADTLDDIRQKGVLTVGTGVMGSKPWIWKNEDGSLAGMDYDMVQYIIKKLGVPKAEFVAVEWETLIPGLKSKRWDIIFSGMTITEERRQGAGIEFSRPYYFESDRIVVKSDSPYQKPEDLAGKILAVPIGTVEEIQGKLLVSKGIGGEVKAFNDNAGCFLALQSGQVDAVIMDNTTTAGQMQVTPNMRTIGGVYNLTADPKWQAAQAAAPYKFGGDGVGIRKEDTALLAAINQALDDMDADGTREAILKKYGVWDASLTKEAIMNK